MSETDEGIGIEPDESYLDIDGDEEEYCPRCGKPFEDFSDLGCAYCDWRKPDLEIIP